MLSTHSQRGFTLTEIAIVLALIGVLASYSIYTFRTSRALASLKDAKASLVLTLEDARSKAATGSGSSDHGVRINTNEIISFEGTDYAGRASEFKVALPNGVSSSQNNLDIIFERLSTELNIGAVTTITLTSASTSSTTQVTISPDGAIN